MGSLLAALTTMIVTVLAAALAAPYVLDWNDYKYMFEAQATKMIGRAVRVDGSVGLTILPVPEVRLKGVRVADEAGSFKHPFAEVENFNMTLSLSPLLSGTIEAKKIELDQPVMRFQVDASGRGNWTSLGTGASDGSAQVVLSNVTIRDGAIEYRGAPDASPTRIDQISGAFSADSLSGPFRFLGFGAIGRDRRELKLSASKAQRDNAYRLKASLGSPGGGSLYQLDGDLKNVGGTMQYVGPVLARLEIGGPVPGKGDKQDQPPRARAIELRAGSVVTLQDARLQDIALTVTENERPQSFTGSAYAAWGDDPRLDLSVQTAFLDIDQMIGTPERGANPLAVVAALPKIFEGWPFEPRQGKIRATIQQATLGGDTLEGINFAATHNREFWQVETLEARLPGDAPLSINGVLQPGENVGFTGELNLSGRNLSRLLRWAAPSLGAVDTGDAQRFTLKGGVTYADQRFTFRRGAGELGDSTFSGDLAYDFSADSKLLLTLQSERLDLRSIYGGSNPFAAESAEPAPPPADGTAAKTSLVDAFRSVFKAKQTNIALRIAQLSMPDLEARDVRTSFRYENGNLDIRELNLATTDGLSIKADGALTNFDTSPNGSVNLGINAPSTASLANLAKLFGLESFGAAAQRRMDALAPLRLNGRLSGNRQDRLMNLTLAGNAAGSELTLNGRFDGEFNALKDARIDVNGTIANADGRRLIAQLAPEVPLAAEVSRPGAGVLKITALGALKSGLISKLELRTPDSEGRFEGQLALLDSPSWSLNGDLWLRAVQASTALSMLRMSPGGTPISGELDLRAALSKKAETFKVDNVSLQIGGETIAGNATVDISGERPIANVDVRATTIVLPKLAAYLVDWDRKDATATAEGVLAGKGMNWPNQSFSFRSFDAIEGSLKVKGPSVVLADGITLANGQLDASMKGGTLTVETLKGQLYSGNFTGSGTLAASNGRVILKGRLKLDKADLARLTVASDGKPLAKANGEFRLAFSGEGLSPRGLLTVLSGKGRVRLNKGTLFGLSPAVLGQAADTYLTEEIPQQAKLTQRIAKDLRPVSGSASVPFRGFIAPVVLKDGVIEVRNAGFKSPDYLATANLFVDLSSNKLDSEWSLAWRGKMKVPNAPLAPVRLVFAGPVADFARLQPQIQTDQYERLLSMQRMDRDMERLEKLNRTPAPGQPSGVGTRDQIVARPPAAATPPSAVLGTQPPLTANAAPPPSAPLPPNGGLPTQQTATPPQPNTPPPAANWATDVEAAGKAAARAGNRGEAQQPAGAFEDQIRQILEEERRRANTSQQAPPSPAPRTGPQSGLSYQTQSYSQTSPAQEDSAAGPQAADTPEEPVSAFDDVPLPTKKGVAPRRTVKPSGGFWDIFQ